MLIIEEDRVEAGILAFHLRQAGLVPLVVVSEDEALDAMGWGAPKAILAELQGRHLDALRFARGLEGVPVSLFLMADRPLTLDEELEALRLGVVGTLRKPLDQDQVVHQLQQATPRPVGPRVGDLPEGAVPGRLEEHSLEGLLRLLHRHRGSARVHVEIAGDWTILFVRQGELLDAEGPGVVGRDAAVSALAQRQGHFVLYPLDPQDSDLTRPVRITDDVATLLQAALGARTDGAAPQLARVPAVPALDALPTTADGAPRDPVSRPMALSRRPEPPPPASDPAPEPASRTIRAAVGIPNAGGPRTRIGSGMPKAPLSMPTSLPEAPKTPQPLAAAPQTRAGGWAVDGGVSPQVLKTRAWSSPTQAAAGPPSAPIAAQAPTPSPEPIAASAVDLPEAQPVTRPSNPVVEPAEGITLLDATVQAELDAITPPPLMEGGDVVTTATENATVMSTPGVDQSSLEQSVAEAAWMAESTETRDGSDAAAALEPITRQPDVTPAPEASESVESAPVTQGPAPAASGGRSWFKYVVMAAVIGFLGFGVAERMGYVGGASAKAQPEPASADTLLKDGQEAMKSGDAEGATKAFKGALKLVPDHTGAQLGLAGAHLAADRPASARRLLDKLITKQPDNAIARYYMGVAAQKLSDPAGAKAAFEDYLQRQSTGPLADQARVALKQLAPN